MMITLQDTKVREPQFYQLQLHPFSIWLILRPVSSKIAAAGAAAAPAAAAGAGDSS